MSVSIRSGPLAACSDQAGSNAIWPGPDRLVMVGPGRLLAEVTFQVGQASASPLLVTVRWPPPGPAPKSSGNASGSTTPVLAGEARPVSGVSCGSSIRSGLL